MGKPFNAVMTQPPSSPSAGQASSGGSGSEELQQLLEKLQEDRLWLLRELDSGRWPQWRLDLAALEREMGQLLDQAAERLG
jgi:hypothetical protein